MSFVLFSIPTDIFPTESCWQGAADADLCATISELAREKMWSRIYLIPLLEAEEDRDQVRRYLAAQEREKELMGKTEKAYHSDRFVVTFAQPIVGIDNFNRFVRPTFAVTPGGVTK